MSGLRSQREYTITWVSPVFAGVAGLLAASPPCTTTSVLWGACGTSPKLTVAPPGCPSGVPFHQGDPCFICSLKASIIFSSEMTSDSRTVRSFDVISTPLRKSLAFCGADCAIAIAMATETAPWSAAASFAACATRSTDARKPGARVMPTVISSIDWKARSMASVPLGSAASWGIADCRSRARHQTWKVRFISSAFASNGEWEALPAFHLDIAARTLGGSPARAKVRPRNAIATGSPLPGLVTSSGTPSNMVRWTPKNIRTTGGWSGSNGPRRINSPWALLGAGPGRTLMTASCSWLRSKPSMSFIDFQRCSYWARFSGVRSS